MILELFVVLIAMALFIVWLGYHMSVPAYSTVGFFFVFLLSLVILTNQLQYQTGVIITDLGNSTTQVINTNAFYSDSSSHWIGYFLAVASAGGMIWSFTNQRKTNMRS